MIVDTFSGTPMKMAADDMVVAKTGADGVKRSARRWALFERAAQQLACVRLTPQPPSADCQLSTFDSVAERNIFLKRQFQVDFGWLRRALIACQHPTCRRKCIHSSNFPRSRIVMLTLARQHSQRGRDATTGHCPLNFNKQRPSRLAAKA